MIEILTIGAYGWTEPEFLDALEAAGADVFCDLRRRRGVRGSEYAFVNHQRLEAALTARGIPYRHFLELAPSPELRAGEAARDREARVKKRLRTELSEEFQAGFAAECLAHWDAAAFAAGLAPAARPALFCVEREPAACHRSLVAARLAATLSLPLRHLVPGQGGGE